MSYSQIQGTVGQLASAILVTSGSSVKLSNMRIEDLAAPSNCTKYEGTGVIVGKQGGSISVINSNFTANDCSYIYSDRTPVEIAHSRFVEGKRSPYVNMKGSILSVFASDFSNTTNPSELSNTTYLDYKTLGKAIKCEECTQVVIKDSNFSKLQGNKGGAIYLKNSLETYLQSNTFEGNVGRQGGAIYIQNSEVSLRDNTFSNNQAAASLELFKLAAKVDSEKLDEEDEFEVVPEVEETLNPLGYQRNEGRGGAIFFTCIDDEDAQGQYIVTVADDCPTDKSDSEYLSCIEEQGQDGEDLESLDIAADSAKCDLSIQDNIWQGN